MTCYSMGVYILTVVLVGDHVDAMTIKRTTGKAHYHE